MADGDFQNDWRALAARVLEGYQLTQDDGLAILRSDDRELLELLAAAYRVRHHYFGNRVHLNFLINAKSGLCGEDCGYCSQSRVSRAAIDKYDLLRPAEILEGARLAAQQRAGTYCIVTSGRTLAANDLETILDIVPQVKAAYDLKICVSPGLLDAQQARRLKACGVDRVNHNLNTSQRFYPRICTTHTYQDRLNTLHAVREAGLEICCGGIIGMGEADADVVELALRVGQLRAEAVPLNFLIPIPGAAIIEACAPNDALAGGVGGNKGTQRLDPRYCLKALALFRLANPRCELRIAAGRELHLGPLQPLGLYAANSIFVGDYLTTKGQPPEDDYRMIEAMGFEAVTEEHDTPRNG